MADTDTAFGWLADHDISADRMGVIGFDLGGSVALLVAAKRTPRRGGHRRRGGRRRRSRPPVCPRSSTPRPDLTCPWLGIYGESGDGEAPEIGQLRDAAASSEVATNVVVYPRSGHRFDSRSGRRRRRLAAHAELVRLAPALTAAVVPARSALAGAVIRWPLAKQLGTGIA